MMEATNRNQIFRLLFVLFTIILALHENYIYAQSTPDPKLAQLLDSAEILKLRRKYSNAIILCKDVIAMSKVKEDWESNARAHSELAEINRLNSELELAANYLNRVFKIISDHGLENSLEFARYYLFKAKLLGSINQEDIVSIFDSIIYFTSVAEKLSQNLTPQNKVFRADLLNAQGFLYVMKGDREKADYYYRQLTSLLDSSFHELNYRRGLYFLFMAIYYFNSGDYERSKLLSNIGSYIMAHETIYDVERYIDCEQQLANNYFEAKDYKKAINQYKKIIDFITNHYGERHSELIAQYINISQPLLNIGEYEQALKYSKRAIEMIQDYSDFSYYLYFIYNNMAEAYENMREYTLAEEYFSKTIQSRIQLFGKYNEEVYEGYRYFGEYFERRGSHLKALNYFQKSLTALFNDFEPKSVHDNPDFTDYSNIEPLLYVLFDKASSLFKLYSESKNEQDLKEAYSLYLTIYLLLDKLIYGNLLDQSSIQIFQLFEDEFNVSIKCALTLHEISAKDEYLNQAFQFVEKNKYFLLYKALMESNSFSDSKNQNISLNMRTLSKEIEELKKLILEQTDPDSLFTLRNRLLQKLDDKEMLNPLRKDNNTFSIQGEDIVKIADAQNLLSNDADILLEYHWSDETIFAFVIGKTFVDIIKIEKSSELLNHIEGFASALENEQISKENFQKYSASAFYLYDHVFKPLEDAINKKFDQYNLKHIIIIPDGPLSTLPFEAFITEPDNTSHSYWGLKYLCKKYAISYAYSLNILHQNLNNHPENNSGGMLALSYSKQLNKKSDIVMLRNENELPYSGEEIASINRITKTTAFLGDDATEDVFKANASNYSYIHLAVHGQADTTDIFNSKLVFKQNENSIEDGELHAYELYDVDLSSSKMIVLSACETGIGKHYEGEGIFSIARGFAYAGCPSIVMSLWKVNDKATAKLMEYFYQNLESGMTKDLALQQAKITFIENSDDLGAHPSNWASFISLGNNEPIQLAGTSMNLYYWIGMLMILVFILTFIIKFKKIKI